MTTDPKHLVAAIVELMREQGWTYDASARHGLYMRQGNTDPIGTWMSIQIALAAAVEAEFAKGKEAKPVEWNSLNGRAQPRPAPEKPAERWGLFEVKDEFWAADANTDETASWPTREDAFMARAGYSPFANFGPRPLPADAVAAEAEPCDMHYTKEGDLRWWKCTLNRDHGGPHNMVPKRQLDTPPPIDESEASCLEQPAADAPAEVWIDNRVAFGEVRAYATEAEAAAYNGRAVHYVRADGDIVRRWIDQSVGIETSDYAARLAEVESNLAVECRHRQAVEEQAQHDVEKADACIREQSRDLEQRQDTIDARNEEIRVLKGRLAEVERERDEALTVMNSRGDLIIRDAADIVELRGQVAALTKERDEWMRSARDTEGRFDAMRDALTKRAEEAEAARNLAIANNAGTLMVERETWASACRASKLADEYKTERDEARAKVAELEARIAREERLARTILRAREDGHG